MRWSRVAEPAQPWIPRGLSFGAEDNFVWSTANTGTPHVSCLSVHGSGAKVPLAIDATGGMVSGTLMSTAADDASAFYSLAQYPAPDSSHRSTRVAQYRPLDAAQGGALTPAWTYDAGLITNGPARIAVDARGECVVLAVWNNATSRVQVDWLSGSDGVRRARVSLNGANLSALAVSADGMRTVVSTGLDWYVLSETLEILHHGVIPSSTPAVAISGKGERVAVGGMGKLSVWKAVGAGYALDFEVAAPASELSTRAALSSDATTLAIGWWNFSNGVDLRMEVWDVATRTRLREIVQVGTRGGLQNLVEAIRITADGRRIAFGCWGDGSTKPELLLCDRSSAVPVLSIDLPGSVQSLALDHSGTRVAVGLKHVHANQLGNTGEVRLYDTGERDLQLVTEPRIGATVEVTARRAGATSVLFLMGARRATPFSAFGMEGSLYLKRAHLAIFNEPADAAGRASLWFSLPPDPALIGTQHFLQAAYRSGLRVTLGETLLAPFVY